MPLNLQAALLHSPWLGSDPEKGNREGLQGSSTLSCAHRAELCTDPAARGLLACPHPLILSTQQGSNSQLQFSRINDPEVGRCGSVSAKNTVQYSRLLWEMHYPPF